MYRQAVLLLSSTRTQRYLHELSSALGVESPGEQRGPQRRELVLGDVPLSFYRLKQTLRGLLRIESYLLEHMGYQQRNVFAQGGHDGTPPRGHK